MVLHGKDLVKIKNMKIQNKTFTPNHINKCHQIKTQAIEEFGLNPVNNICLIIKKLEETINLEGSYVECGTFKGNTLIPAVLSNNNPNRHFYGIDSFKGFPIKEHHPKDLPPYFSKLFSDKEITEEHYNKAKTRTNDLTSLDHLESEYFLDVDKVFINCEQFNNITLLKGTFNEVTPSFNKKISVLHLDGDLYESYLTCLNNLYDNVVKGGCIIFDEYYSHKYPGARVAVNEFFSNKLDQGYFEKYTTAEGHERWCFNKTV